MLILLLFWHSPAVNFFAYDILTIVKMMISHLILAIRRQATLALCIRRHKTDILCLVTQEDILVFEFQILF